VVYELRRGGRSACGPDVVVRYRPGIAVEANAQAADGPRIAPPDDNPGPQSVELGFVDLLYAVPVADLAVRVSGTTLHHVTPSGWGDVGLALTTITLGWIGHHSNRQKLPPGMRANRLRPVRNYWSRRFVQFVVEVLIVIVYFALGTRSFLPAGAGVGRAGTVWKAECLLAVFILYLIWDLLDAWIASKPARAWADRALRGACVTFVFVVVFAAFVGVALANPHPSSVVLFDLVAIGLLYAYRVVQELVLRAA
jgi:hypothetical protein